MANPFNLSFGLKPVQFISRIEQTREITQCFEADPASAHAYVITGVRGSGKTVMLSAVTERLQSGTWVIIDLSSATDYIEELALEMYEEKSLKPLFTKAKLEFSFLGLGVTLEKSAPTASYKQSIRRMLEEAQRDRKKILIIIDEVVSNEAMRQFTKLFQLLVRNNYPIFLLMTGLYENIYELQNDQDLTFLYRAPKVYLGPLNYSAIAGSYRKTLHVDMETAEALTRLTKGYAYAYQVLGYLYWNEMRANSQVPVRLEDLMPTYDHYLQEGVYEKIWSKLSANDRRIVTGIGELGRCKVKDLRDALGMSSAEFSVYRDRLQKKGLLDTRERGVVDLTLPRFDQFVRSMMDFEF